ncbi:hypothetical protein A1353_13465 [Methylomonas methanica]|uniref:Uncharacterized protein n=1 Tax=Methylomonas methanica TaxID=421 RepID=A0A177MGE1_METMH|nr:hypothetical protein A1353_13465 [Methylomonas methanica]
MVLDMLMVVCDTYNDVVNELIVVIRFTLTLHKKQMVNNQNQALDRHTPIDSCIGGYHHAVSFSGRNFVNFSKLSKKKTKNA